MVYFPHSIFFDSSSWELNSGEECKWARHLHQKFTSINLKVQHQNILVSYRKKSESCWQTQESRRGHGNRGYHRLLQATGQRVTDTISDTWQRIFLWCQQELRQVPKWGSLGQQIPVQSSTELNTLIHAQASHASTHQLLGETWREARVNLGREKCSCQRRSCCSCTGARGKFFFAPTHWLGFCCRTCLLANSRGNYVYHVLGNDNYPQKYKAFLKPTLCREEAPLTCTAIWIQTFLLPA